MLPRLQFDSVWNRCASHRSIYSYLQANTTPALPIAELLRAEWAARVSALDLYVHEVVAQGMVDVFEGRRTATAAYQRFAISLEASTRIRTAASAPEASAAFDLYVREKLGRNTFQFPDEIADGIRLCSDLELWNEIALRRGATQSDKSDQAKAIKLQLSAIINRRNKIVHEGDLQPGPTREPWIIDLGQAQTVAATIVAIVSDIDALLYPPGPNVVAPVGTSGGTTAP